MRKKYRRFFLFKRKCIDRFGKRRCKEEKKLRKNSLLFRPQLKAHNSMLKVIEDNCKSNSRIPLKIDFGWTLGMECKTNVVGWPSSWPLRSIKRNAVSRERVCSRTMRRDVVLSPLLPVAAFVSAFNSFNQIKTSWRVQERKISSFAWRPGLMFLLCRLLKLKSFNLTSFVCYDYLTVNSSTTRSLVHCCLLFTRLQSDVRPDAPSKI